MPINGSPLELPSSAALSLPIIATDQCPSMPNISVHQCCILVPISDACQCLLISAVCQCCLSLPIAATYQCKSVLPFSAHW
ncbi:unnamed protein product [Staurois parvus]|uniref:Uncharacterized protein n=1 Tax=Staurois parvus TaxID=386267 RepID=A0ABN9AMM2_9NEOB|nr:unnamed protein product [Staurois parvus]